MTFDNTTTVAMNNTFNSSEMLLTYVETCKSLYAFIWWATDPQNKKDKLPELDHSWFWLLNNSYTENRELMLARSIVLFNGVSKKMIPFFMEHAECKEEAKKMQKLSFDKDEYNREVWEILQSCIDFRGGRKDLVVRVLKRIRRCSLHRVARQYREEQESNKPEGLKAYNSVSLRNSLDEVAKDLGQIVSLCYIGICFESPNVKKAFWRMMKNIALQAIAMPEPPKGDNLCKEIVYKAKPVGSIKVSRWSAKRVAIALATGDHPWTYRGEHFQGPLALPKGGDPVEEANIIDWSNGDKEDFWRPVFKTTDKGWLWRPWSGQTGRWIEITQDGVVSWDSGTGKPSRFIGELLIAAAGGLKELPRNTIVRS